MTLHSSLSTAVMLFASTNVDNLILVMVLFAVVQRGTLKPMDIVAGQYLGFTVSVLAARGAAAVPLGDTRWLGVLPAAFGTRDIVTRLRAPAHSKESSRGQIGRGGLLGITATTLAGGGDNLAVYTPWFRAQPLAGAVMTIAVFAALLAVLLGVGATIGSHPRAFSSMDSIGNWLNPAIYISLGALIFVRA